MSVRQQSLLQQIMAYSEEGDGDSGTCSTDTSRWSTPSTLDRGSNSPQYPSDCEDQGKFPAAKTSDKWRGSKTTGRKRDKNAQGDYKQKTSYAAHCKVLKLPQIKSLQVSKPRTQSGYSNCIRELESQVGDLQQQLSEAQAENKLLKRLQRRHTVALQHFQESEGSISQILTKHSNEVRALQGQLRETRSCRDRLARQLQTSEKKLLNTTTTLQHLQLLTQDQSLLERKELTNMLDKATAKLEEKGKRILDLERNLELCQASFTRQLVTEKKKTNQVRQISCHLQEQVYQLTKEIQDRRRELDTHNIYSRRLLKGSTKKDGPVLLPTEVKTWEFENPETEETLEKQQSCVKLFCFDTVQTLKTKMEDPIPVTSEDTPIYAETSEKNSGSKKSIAHQTERAAEASIVGEGTSVSEEEQKTKCEGEFNILGKSLNTSESTRKGYKLPKIKHNHAFNQTSENPLSGRPACSSVDASPCESTKITTEVEALRSGISELSIVGLQAGEYRGGGGGGRGGSSV